MFKKLTRKDRPGLFCAVVFVCLIWATKLQAAPSVRIAWDANPETNIKGYRIYYGVNSGGSTNVIDVGHQTTGTVTNLAYSTGYFFYVTAYNVFDLESDPSQKLLYTTPAFQPLSLTTDDYLIALVPSVVTLRATLQGDRQPGTTLSVNWTQGAGQTPIPIANASTLTPAISIGSPGFYSFTVKVVEGATTLQKSLFINAYQATAATGSTPLKLDPPFYLADGLVFSWDSIANHTYSIGYKRDLNDTYWVLIARDIASLGDKTYWLNNVTLPSTAFFTIFDLP